MKFFVTGVNGQLGHDVMNELYKRGHEGVGSDLAEAYAGVADGSPVTAMPYVSLDITDKEFTDEELTLFSGIEKFNCQMDLFPLSERTSKKTL